MKPGEFEELFWEDFRVRDALRLLSREEPLYVGYRHCVLAALSAWVIAPDDADLRQSAVATAAATELRSIEKPAVTGTSKKSQIQPLANMLLAQDFLVEIYYPIGGIAAISDAQTPRTIGALLKKRAVSLSRALLMMHIAHWIRDQDDPHLLPLSVERSSRAAAEILRTARRLRGTARTLKKDWTLHRPNIAIAYAASSIQVTTDRSLLDCFMVGNIGRIKPQHIRDLIGRARYLSENVLIELRNSDTRDASKHLFSGPAHPEQSFPPRSFDGDELIKLVEAYARKKWVRSKIVPAHKSRPEISLC